MLRDCHGSATGGCIFTGPSRVSCWEGGHLRARPRQHVTDSTVRVLGGKCALKQIPVGGSMVSLTVRARPKACPGGTDHTMGGSCVCPGSESRKCHMSFRGADEAGLPLRAAAAMAAVTISGSSCAPYIVKNVLSTCVQHMQFTVTLKNGYTYIIWFVSFFS